MTYLYCTSMETHVSVSTRTLGKSSIAEANPYPFDDDVWWIARVLVHHSFRGKGLGSELLQKLVKEVKAQGAKAIIVAPGGYNSNYNRQVHFYEKNGFKQAEEGLYRMELTDDDARQDLARTDAEDRAREADQQGSEGAPGAQR